MAERMAAHLNIEAPEHRLLFEPGHEYFAKCSGQISVYTGPVDCHFDYAEGDPSWRTIDLEEEVLRLRTSQVAPMNHPDADVPLHQHPRVPLLPPRA